MIQFVWQMKFKQLFAISWFFMGLLVCLIVPPFQVPDEVSHWNTALFRSSFSSARCQPGMGLPHSFSYSEGGENRPIGFREMKDVNGCLSVEFYYGSLLTYPGILLTRWWGGEHTSGRVWLILFYLTRVFQGLFMGAFLYFFANYFQHAGVLTILALCCSPLFLQQSFGVTADTVVFAFGLVAVMWLFSKRPFHLEFKTTQLPEWGTIFLAIIACTTKAPMLLPGLFCLFLAWTRNKDWLNLKKHKLFIGAIFSWIALTGIASKQSTEKVMEFEQITPGFKTYALAKGPVNPVDQIEFMKTHLLDLPKIFLPTLKEDLQLQSYAGKLGWWSVTSDRLTIRLWEFLVFFMFLTEIFLMIRPLKIKLNRKLGVAIFTFILAILSSVVLQEVGLYLSFTPVGYFEPLGLQPRYFFPQLILVVAFVFWLIQSTIGFRKWNDESRRWHKFILGLYIPLWSISLFLDFAFKFQ